jgi:aryl-alcohol dehydrogenase-like predicted oxidoreductase
VNFLDTADIYGPAHERGAGRQGDRGAARRGFPGHEVRHRAGPEPHDRGANGRPDYVKASCDGSLKRLGLDTIDLYYQHRVDPNTPIEDTVGAMVELKQAGKIRHIGLSEASSKTLRRAARVHPITALQSEYSLWSRDVEDDILATCRELGIGFVPYSPLGRGFLTGQIKRFEDLAPDDFRRNSPRFQGENFARNLALVERIGEIASEKGVTKSQLALAWVLAQGDDIVPIFGTKRRSYLADNLGALDVVLTPADLARIEAVAPKGAAAGERYPEVGRALIDR